MTGGNPHEVTCPVCKGTGRDVLGKNGFCSRCGGDGGVDGREMTVPERARFHAERALVETKHGVELHAAAWPHVTVALAPHHRGQLVDRLACVIREALEAQAAPALAAAREEGAKAERERIARILSEDADAAEASLRACEERVRLRRMVAEELLDNRFISRRGV